LKKGIKYWWNNTDGGGANYSEKVLFTSTWFITNPTRINPLNAELNPIGCLLALLGAHHFLHVRRIRVNNQNNSSETFKYSSNL
jgi:hypothetical protein